MLAVKTLVNGINHYGLRSTPKNQRIWLIASLAFAVLYGILFWQIAFASPYSIQDDARQHVFWMWRYVDPTLFPNDIIADYFQSVAPLGYKALYRLGTVLGIDPFVFSKLLPPILSIIGTIYTFYLALEIIPVPLVAFFNTLILNQSLWMWDELGSATPKAFSVLLIVAFLLHVARRQILGCALIIGCQGLLYPHLVFIAVLVLALQTLWPGSNKRKDLVFFGVGTAVAIGVLLPYVLATSPYGPVVTLEQAKTMAEFQPSGRNAFFYSDWARYWLFSGRSGLLPPVVPVTIGLSLLFPILVGLRLPLLRHITPKGKLILQLGIAALIMFLLSHGLLFTLHLPSRYSRHVLKVIVALGSAMVLAALLDEGLRRVLRPAQSLWRQMVALAIAAGIGMATVGYPLLLNSFLNVVYIQSNKHALYEYLQQQPKDIQIASLIGEAENIPTFTGRSVLVSRGHSLAYHQGYYQQIRPRILDLIAAQYSPDLSTLQTTIINYDIDFWLVDGSSFNPELIQRQWIRQFETELTTAVTQLQKQPSALQRLLPTCAVLSDQGETLMAADCLLAAAE